MSDLKQGDLAILIKYKFNKDFHYKQKLLEFGFVPGVKFRVSRVAPLGDPIELCFNNITISVRRVELNMIVVKKIDK